MSIPNQTIQKKEAKLRIQFIHRPIKKRLRFRRYSYPIQNIPFEFGIKITNIGEIAFNGAEVNNFTITIHDAKISNLSHSIPQIRSLNPQESIDVFFDKYTSLYCGPIWLSCDLVPKDTNTFINSYQYDKNHNKDSVFSTENKWGEAFFIQGKFELLQSNTNSLILLLTVVTVIEAVFGIKKILQVFFSILSRGFSLLSQLFFYLSS